MPAPHDKTPEARATEKRRRKEKQAYARMMQKREMRALREENKALRELVLKLSSADEKLPTQS